MSFVLDTLQHHHATHAVKGSAQALLPDLQKLKATVDTLAARVGGVQ